MRHQVLATGPQLDIRAVVSVLKAHLLAHETPASPAPASSASAVASGSPEANPKTARLGPNSSAEAAAEVRLLCLQWLQLFLLERRDEVKEQGLQEELLCAALLALRHHDVVSDGGNFARGGSSAAVLQMHSGGSDRPAASATGTSGPRRDVLSGDNRHCLSASAGEPRYTSMGGLDAVTAGPFGQQTGKRIGGTQSCSGQATAGADSSSSSTGFFVSSGASGDMKTGRRPRTGYDVVMETALRVLAMLADQGRPVFEALVDRLLEVFQHDRRMMVGLG